MRALVALILMLVANSTERNAARVRVQVQREAQVPEILLPREPWTFAVLSDLHLPNELDKNVRDTVAALVKQKVRFVIITGDHTNGSDKFRGRSRKWQTWWPTIRETLQPLRDAKIPVLPIAGNHDTYWPWQRDAYAKAFADLDEWAAPLEINESGPRPQAARAPFSYSVDVDGVHLALANIVAQRMQPEVAAWLTDDLAGAQFAKRRIVFGHVPMVSVIRPPNLAFAAKLGAILEAGNVSHYVAGHEHIVWNETFALPHGGHLEQINIGCSSGFYQFPPSKSSKLDASCERMQGKRNPMRCTMPDTGGEFMIAIGRKHRLLQTVKASYTLFTVDGDDIRIKPMTIVNHEPEAFYLDQR